MMNNASGVPTQPTRPTEPWSRAIVRPPSTRLGWGAIALAGLFGLLWSINSMVFMPLFMYEAVESPAWMPYYGVGMLLVGLAASSMGLLAVVWRHERSGLVLLTLLPGLSVLILLAGEFLVPH